MHPDCIPQHASGPFTDRIQFGIADDSASLPDSMQIHSVRGPTMRKTSCKSGDPSLAVKADDSSTFNVHKWLEQTSEEMNSEETNIHSESNSSTVSGPDLAISECNGLQAAHSDCGSIHAVAAHEVRRGQSSDLVSCTSTATWSVSEEDFRRDLAALDAGIAQLQRQLLDK